MSQSKSLLLQILEEVGKTNNYEIENLDEISGYLMKVIDIKSNKSFITSAGDCCAYPLNSATSYGLSKDKTHTINILRRANLRTPQGDYFFLTDKYSAVRGNGKTLLDSQDYANSLGYPLIVKPNKGSLGKDIALVNNDVQLEKALLKVKESEPLARIEEFIAGDEMRIFVFDDKIQFSYLRTRPKLTGNGIATIGELLAKINNNLYLSGNSSIAEDDAWLLNSLKSKNLSLNSVLKQGQTIEYTVRANLHGGGEVEEFIFEPPQEIQDIAIQATKLLNLRIAGIDIILPKGIADPKNYYILEINGNPWISSLYNSPHRNKVYELWADVCNKYFGPC